MEEYKISLASPPCFTNKLCFLRTSKPSYFEVSSIATATATVAPTIGLLPIPIRPIISLGLPVKADKIRVFAVIKLFIYD